MATPISPATRLFIKSSAEADIIKASDYWTSMAKKHKLDEGIVKTFMMTLKSGEEATTDDLDTPAAKKSGKELIKCLKADLKSHEANKAEFEKNEEAAKVAAKAAKQAIKDAADQDKKESGAAFALVLEDDALVSVKSQLTEQAISTITSHISEKFALDENGIIKIDPNNIPTKQEFTEALGAVTTMVGAGQEMSDSASRFEAQVGFHAKKHIGESWVNLFSATPEIFSRVQKGVKIYETVDSFKNKAARKLFGQLPFTTTRALLEFKITTAEIEGSKEKADEINVAAKKEVFLAAAKLVEEGGEDFTLTQKAAKQLVTDYKKGHGIEPAAKVHFIHFTYIEKTLKVFGATDPKPNKDYIRLSMLSFDLDGNRLVLAADGKNIEKKPLDGPEADVAAYMHANASPPELTKDQKAAAALREKEAAAAAKAAAKASKGKKPAAGAADEQEEDAPSTKAVVKNQTAAPADEEESTEQEEEETTAATTGADEEDDLIPAPKGSKVVVTDDEDE